MRPSAGRCCCLLAIGLAVLLVLGACRPALDPPANTTIPPKKALDTPSPEPPPEEPREPSPISREGGPAEDASEAPAGRDEVPEPPAEPEPDTPSQRAPLQLVTDERLSVKMIAPGSTDRISRANLLMKGRR